MCGEMTEYNFEYLNHPYPLGKKVRHSSIIGRSTVVNLIGASREGKKIKNAQQKNT